MNCKQFRDLAPMPMHDVPDCLQRAAILHAEKCPHCQEWSARLKRNLDDESVAELAAQYERVMRGGDHGLSGVS